MKKKNKKSRIDLKIDAVDRSLQRFSDRKIKSIEKSMLSPLYQEFLKFLYIIFVMLFEVFLLLEILISISNPYNIILFIITLIISFYLVFEIYNRIWGNKGPWSIEKNK
jgi:hypothetical protein